MAPWCMMYADEVLCSETRDGIVQKFEQLATALEERGIKINRSKTEYTCLIMVDRNLLSELQVLIEYDIFGVWDQLR